MRFTLDEKKQTAARAAVQHIKDGMVVGLGSGSTVNFLLKELGESVKKGLDIHGIPSSRKTEKLAMELNIPLVSFSEINHIDIAIDGADEIDGNLHLLKGGGGSLVREKIVASAANKLIIIADDTKSVPDLGAFSLPVEVVPFGWEATARKIATQEIQPKLRKKNGEVFVSDNGNYILDCACEPIRDPQTLHESLNQMVGVVETGLFVGMADEVIIADNDGVNVRNR